MTTALSPESTISIRTICRTATQKPGALIISSMAADRGISPGKGEKIEEGGILPAI
jgi:hypothetical protein